MEFFQSIIQLKSFSDNSVAFKLLRSRSLPLIISFLHREFKGGEQLSIPYTLLISKLADYLEELNYWDEEEETQPGKMLLDYDERAKLFIDKWDRDRYLRIVVDDHTKDALVLLSKHVEKVFQVFNLLQEKDFIGTESKFKDIFNKLADLIENANPDKEKRLEDLEKRKKGIEEEIRRIKTDGYIVTYEDYQIKSRFDDVNRLANELIGDFKEVEDNFKDITRKIYEKQQDTQLTKGRLLRETFDAIYELRATSQGKSFYAFWQFMIDDESQERLHKLTQEIYNLLKERGITYTSRSLRKLKYLLHAAGRKVLEKNDLLADKLSKEIVSRDQLERKKTKELMNGIRQAALRMMNAPPDREYYLEIDGEPDLYLPMERKLSQKPEENKHVSLMEKAQVNLHELNDLAKIFSSDMIDKKALLANIHDMLNHKTQVSLKEVTEKYPITKGLAELLAYITLINQSSRYFFNTETSEDILFDQPHHKYLQLPQLIFSK